MADQPARAIVAMEEPQRRLLGYLAAHEGEWAADNDEQWKWAKALKARGFALAEVVGFLPAEKSPTVSRLADQAWVAVEVILEEKQERELIPRLKRAGATGIITYPLNKVIP